MNRLYTLIPLSRSCSSVWLERLPVTQEVAGSNPVSSAKKAFPVYKQGRLFYLVKNFLKRRAGSVSLFFFYPGRRLLLTDLLR